MSLGEKLLELRKRKSLSQEEAADILGVTRQTISKWETDQSTPDFDKIVPICELYNITANELIMGEERDEPIIYNETDIKKDKINKEKRIEGIAQGVFIFFVAISWIMISPTVLAINPIIASAIFLLICGLGTYKLMYTSMLYKEKKQDKINKNITKGDKERKQIGEILAIATLIIYLCVSFGTSRWDVTWILWIVFVFAIQILKFIFLLRGEDNEVE